MVEDSGFEPLTQACKASVFPIRLIPHNSWSEMKDSNLRSSAPKADGLNQTFLISEYGASCWIRTNDIHFVRVALYQLS